jgi:hypothetical protein
MIWGMSNTKLPHWLRIRFSLRMLFVVVTAFGIWMGWQVHIVHERKHWRRVIMSHGGSFIDFVADQPPHNNKTTELPWFRRLLGDRAIESLWLYPGCSEEDKTTIEELFPEADFDAPKPEPPGIQIAGWFAYFGEWWAKEKLFQSPSPPGFVGHS